MKDDTFRLPRSSYQELVKIISAYGQTDEPVSLSEISALSTLGSTAVSSNNAFLVGVGLIEGGNKKTVTPTGRSLARALIHDMKDEIANSWRAIVEQNEFLSKMIVALKIRRQMEATALVSHICYNSGEKRTKGALAGTRAIIDIFVAAELIKEDAGLLIPNKVNKQVMRTPLLNVISKTSLKETSHSNELVSENEARANPSVNLTIEIHINADTDNIGELGTQLRKLVETLGKPYKDTINNDEE